LARSAIILIMENGEELCVMKENSIIIIQSQSTKRTIENNDATDTILLINGVVLQTKKKGSNVIVIESKGE
jgi:hypothetical protein